MCLYEKCRRFQHQKSEEKKQVENCVCADHTRTTNRV